MPCMPPSTCRAGERIRRNHTATHILHWALREVLGDHVKQAGSYVADSRLRFDFTHFEAMTAEQIAEVERLANQKIMENHPVRAYETSLASAREAGVMALFGEKYGEFVRVLDIEGFSQELCGGTHVSATSEIGFVKITSETSVGANLRRIEAVTSFDALAYMNRVEAELKEAAESLRVPLFDVSERTASNMKTLKDLQTKLKRGREAVADDGINALLETAQTSAAGYPVVFGPHAGGRCGSDAQYVGCAARASGPAGAAVLATEKDGKPTLLAAGHAGGGGGGLRRRRRHQGDLGEHQGRRRRKGRHGAGPAAKTPRASTRPFRLRATCCCRVVGWAPCRGVRRPGGPELARNVHRTFRLDGCGVAKRSVTSPRRGNLAAHPLGTAPEAVLPLGAPALRAALQPAGRLFRRLLRESEKPFFHPGE